jgi:hypothetical protein
MTKEHINITKQSRKNIDHKGEEALAQLGFRIVFKGLLMNDVRKEFPNRGGGIEVLINRPT